MSHIIKSDEYLTDDFKVGILIAGFLSIVVISSFISLIIPRIDEYNSTMYSSQTQCILSGKTKCNKLLVHIYVKENENE